MACWLDVNDVGDLGKQWCGGQRASSRRAGSNRPRTVAKQVVRSACACARGVGWSPSARLKSKAERLHLPGRTSSPSVHTHSTQQREAAVHGHGRGSCRGKQGQKIAQGARHGAKGPGSKWALRPLAILGSPSLAVSTWFEASSRPSGRQRGARAPDPGCLAQALTGQGPF